MKFTMTQRSTALETLIQSLPDTPRTRIKVLLKHGALKRNGISQTRHDAQLEPGDEITISIQAEDKPLKHKNPFPYPVLYEDESLLALDKPAGINTSSTDGSASIFDDAKVWIKAESKGKNRIFVVHRLDKEVSGVLLLVKSESAMEQVKANWPTTEKCYTALVHGHPQEPFGTKESWLMENKMQKMYSVPTEEPGAKFAITHWKVLERQGPYSLMEIKLGTGRKNQIRVHMADLGCPIVGDRKYGADDTFRRRVRLHASQLKLKHPVSGEPIVIVSPLPVGFLMVREQHEIAGSSHGRKATKKPKT